jgi:hypothetical protein
MGKWRYMSPEQARGDTLDTRSDLFSAASVIFELFTGQKLFPGEEAEDIAKNIELMPIPKMTSLRAGLPSRLDDVLGGALARKPIDRPSRPATVLRSLIELSYESSIMATALDVAEALATVIPAKRQSGRGALDDVIRKQLYDNPTAARRTAITDGKPSTTQTGEKSEHSTGLFRKLGADGLAQLEEVDNTKVAAPRARRNSEQVPAMPGDTDMHKLYEAGQDRDRFTEVGGPPTGQVAKDYLPPDSPELKEKSVTGGVAPTGRSRAGRWLVLGVVIAAGSGIGIWMQGRGGGETDPVVDPPVAIDAAPITPAAAGTIDFVTFPEGATGTINGTRFGPTPHRANNVPAGTWKIHLELEGYLPIDYEIKMTAGETVVDRQRFTPAPATLVVTTEPPGVQVTLGGRGLGATPLTRENLTAEKGVTLSLTKAGYEPLSFKVDLERGKTLSLERTLKEAQKFASVQLRVSNGFGDVYLAGKKIGRAPTPKIKLPVGTVKLHLVNSVAKVEWDATCEVTEAGPNICTITQP